MGWTLNQLFNNELVKLKEQDAILGKIIILTYPGLRKTYE